MVDEGKTWDLADSERHPDIVKRLMVAAESAREEMGDCDRIGKGARFYDNQPKRPGIEEYKTWLKKQGQRGSEPGGA
jgi:hypothetical protein